MAAVEQYEKRCLTTAAASEAGGGGQGAEEVPGAPEERGESGPCAGRAGAQEGPQRRGEEPEGQSLQGEEPGPQQV